MDFLDSLVLHQSKEHMILLKYLLVLTFLILIPYLSLLAGSYSLSYYFGKKDKGEQGDYSKLALEMIDRITFNKSVSVAFALVPLLSAVFCFAQLLHLSNVPLPQFLLISFILLLISLYFLYSVKNGLYLQNLYNIINKKPVSPEEDSEDLKKNKNYISQKTDSTDRDNVLGLIFLFLSIYILMGVMGAAADSARWTEIDSVFDILISVRTFLYFLQFVTLAFSLTAVIMLYLYFRPKTEIKSSVEYRKLVKKVFLRIGLVSSIVLPLFIALTVLTSPGASLSADYFIITLILIFVLVLLSTLFYVMSKESSARYSLSVLFLFIIFFVFFIIRDQLAFDTASKEQFTYLSNEYDIYRDKIREEMGLFTVEISGADIYNGRCIACHQFDKKLVGPPYNSVLPKYENKRAELVGFILNPVKVNPEYPAMPNQGLKPNEAEAIADYLIQTYKTNNP